MDDGKDFAKDIGKLLGASESLAAAVTGLRQEIKSTDRRVAANGERIAEVSTMLSAVRSQCGELKQTVLQGNGRPPLTTQMAHLDTQLSTVKSWLKGIDGRISRVGESINKKEEARMLSRKEITVGVIAIVGTALTALAALAGQIWSG